jgi:dihydrofolate reductase
MEKGRSLAVFIASSLDGYIAAEDESLEWLFNVEGEGDNGYSAFYDTVDTILMGKRTYDWIMKHEEGEFPYKNKECYVFTRSGAQDTDEVKFINGDLSDFADKLKSQAGKRIWMVGGGDILQHFFKEMLIDELIITIAPVIIGSGIPLFKEGDYQLDLRLQGTRTFNQFVELQYAVRK